MLNSIKAWRCIQKPAHAFSMPFNRGHCAEMSSFFENDKFSWNSPAVRVGSKIHKGTQRSSVPELSDRDTPESTGEPEAELSKCFRETSLKRQNAHDTLNETSNYAGKTASTIEPKKRSTMMLKTHCTTPTKRKMLVIAALVAVNSLVGSTASADTIYETGTPFGGPFGLIGFDVFQEQKVAVRFTPNADFTLDRVSLWLMNNDGDGGHPPVTVSLRTDNAAAGSIPSDTILEQWQINVSAVGWDPMLEAMDSVTHPTLSAGEHYWIVAESDSGPFINGVWNWATNDSGMMSICNGDPCEWSPAGRSAVAASVIEGTLLPLPGCVADIAPWPGGNGAVNVQDLLAVIGAWGPCGNPNNCEADIAPAGGNDLVNVADLLAVIGAWGACP